MNLTREIQIEAQRLSLDEFAKRHPSPVLVATEILGGELRRRSQPATKAGAEGTVVFPARTISRPRPRPPSSPGEAPVYSGTMSLLQGVDAELIGAEPEMLEDRVLTKPRFVELRKDRSVGRDREIVVGRTQAADVVIADFTVSSRHAMFTFEPRTGQSHLVDLGSTNGSKVGETPVAPNVAVPIRSWDRIVLGRVVTRFLEPADFHTFLVNPSQALRARGIFGGRL